MSEKVFSLSFPHANGLPEASAIFRQQPEDFQVDEDLGFLPSGEGEHVFLHICKKGENTAWVAEQIARLAKVKLMDVGFCGRKDRHAVTLQWFSVYLPLKKGELEPDWSQLNSQSVSLLSVSRHQTKLRKGEHKSNFFVIRLRDVQTENRSVLTQRIEHVFASGVPNYFGEQRFGRGGNNLQEAHQLLIDGRRYKDRQKQGLILSAARSYLFNLVLAERVSSANWCQVLDGEPESASSGPLWGRGRSLAQGDLLELESSVLEPWQDWCLALEHMGLKQERRPLRLQLDSAAYRWVEDRHLELSFRLDAGAFATSVLAELVHLLDPQALVPADAD